MGLTKRDADWSQEHISWALPSLTSASRGREQNLVKESPGKEFREQILNTEELDKEVLCASGLRVAFKTLSLLYAFTKAEEIIATHLSFTGQNYFGKKSMLRNTFY